MLKKKRFSGLFGASMTEIPSPNPEQQNGQSTIVNSNNSSQGFGPQMLSSQGRQSSILSISNSGGIGNFPAQGANNNSSSNNNNSNNNNSNSQGDEETNLNSLTRAEVHQSLDNLKKLVIAAESYRELTAKLAKTTKQLGKCFKEYGDCKGMDNTYVMCLKSSANFYESFSEMESKLATCLQKDFELLQNNWEKHTKRVTKDEKAHDEILGDLDERIKKISLNYDKKSKKPDPNTALMSHEKYISTLSELQDSIAAAKRDHRNTVARRERYTHSLTAQIACRLSEAQFLAIERQLRGSGPSLLKIKEWAPYAGIDMPPPTLVTNGEPSIELRTCSFEEYTARHAGGQQSAVEAPRSENDRTSLGGSEGGIGIGGPNPSVYTITEMPQITLPPFAPMQQHLQQQQQQQQQQPSIPMPIPMPAPVQQQPQQTNLPTVMPDPKQYVPQRQPIPTITQTSTPPVARIDKTTTQIPAVKTVSTDHKVLVKETPVVINTPVKVFQTEKPTPVSTVSTVIASDPIHVLTASPPSTPGAFPESPAITSEKESRATNKLMDLKRRDGIDGYGSFPEDQGSVSTKVGSIDGGSVKGDHTISKVEYLRGLDNSQRLAATAEEVDAAALDRYHTEKFGEQYRYTEEEAAHYRNEQRRDVEHDDMGGIINDDLYDDPYSPTSGDQLSFYEDADDMSRVDQRRYFDDEESQHSGSIPIRDRGEYYSTRLRYEDREYDRSYQQYSSSVPTRQYINERELDRAEWSGPSDNVSVAGYAREQYPSPREYPRRPTLEDRERELDLINQKNGGTRNTYDRRPATASGTVANLRRRFSDQSVSEADSVMGGMVASSQTSQGLRPRGMSGSALNLHQQQQQDPLRRDPRYPPRSSTPQSRLVAATASRYESIVTKGTVSGSVGTGRGVAGRYSSAGGHMSDYEDAGSGRMSVPLGDQRNRRR